MYEGRVIRLTASDPLYPALNELLTIRAQFMNPACFVDLVECPEVERRAFVAWLDAELTRMFEELSS
jgi:hypothetical protein